MKTGRLKRSLLGVLCTGLLAAAIGAVPAQAAPGDPLFVFRASENAKPGGDFNGPCGLAVDVSGNFYVSDYYHHAVNVYTPARAYLNRLSGIGPGDGPCAVALDSTGKVYVNDYHRAVLRYTPSVFPVIANTSFVAETLIDADDPTGVAVNTVNDNVYVNNRTHVSAYSSAGAQFAEIGLGTLVDGYGVAISQHPATFGYLYVPDAATNTVKVYNPLLDAVNPVASLTGPPGGFGSLHDAAVAVDRVSGQVYVAVRQSSPFTERPEATIEVFFANGTYAGHLKYRVVDAEPVGLAVDNSTALSQGRVYVTSGNTTGAAVMAYPPGSAITDPPLPAPSLSGGSTGEVPAPAAGAAAASPTAADSSADPADDASPVVSGSRRRADRRRHQGKRRHHREGLSDRRRPLSPMRSIP